MRYDKTSMIIDPGDKNVSPLWEHIEAYTCSHEVGTSVLINAVFTKSDKVVVKDTMGIYHYKDLTFEINDGLFTCGSLQFKLPERTEVNTFQRVMLSLGFPIVSLDPKDSRIDLQQVPFRDLLHILTTMALKDLKIISGSFSFAKQFNYGKHVFESYLTVVYDSGEVSAKQPSIRWLNEQDTKKLKSKLFDYNSHSYQTGSHYMKYKPTAFAEGIFARVFELLDLLEFVDNKIDGRPLDFKVSNDQLKAIRLRDVMLLFGNCIGYNNGFIIRPQVKDEQYSRVYSVFTSIGSKSRKVLGFNNYDIGAALQTICLHLVDDASKYPLHQELINDKKAFRSKVQDEIDKDLVWVKKELSKINNLDSMPKKYNQFPILKAYYEEALPLREEVLDNAEDVILSRATDIAK